MALSMEEATAQLTRAGGMFSTDRIDIRGVTTTVWKAAPPTLRTVLDMTRAHGEKDYIVFEDERLTYAEHYRRAATLGQRLVAEFGIRKGDRVGLAMRNLPEWPLIFWASVAVGAVIVPLNAWWTADELEYGITDAGCRLLFVDAERLETLEGKLPALGLAATIVARPVGPLPEGVREFTEVLGEVDSKATPPKVALQPDDEATLFYTSGTTGRPKGALGTHRNICQNLISAAFLRMRAALRAGNDPMAGMGGAGPSFLLSVPLFHVTGCHAILCGTTVAGGKLVMMYKWDAQRAIELIERERITTFGGVPAMVWQVLEHPALAEHDLSSVTNVAYGGAPAAPELVRRIQQAFPKVESSNGYGMTETSALCTTNSGVDYLERPDSCGMPAPVTEVRIAGPNGQPLPAGEVGELMVKGPNVIKGYWNRPEADADTFRDGWLRTGDLARLDAEGYLYIVDRAKDMLIRGGENIYCVEVEDALYSHPAVMDAAVIGIPHKVLGEEVGAIVQIAPGQQSSEDELRAHVRERLAHFKVPVRIELRDEPLPRNANGKILKNQLKQEWALAPAG